MSSVLRRVAGLVGMMWVLPGCLEVALIQALQEDDPDDVAVDEGRFDSEIFPEGDETTVDEAVDMRGGTLLGDMGEVQGFEDEAPLLRGWSSEGYTNLEVHAAKADGSGAAMAIVGITGDLSDPELQPGAHLEFSAIDYPETGLYVNLIGCSGPTEGDWQFDQSAETVTLDVSEGATPDSVTYDFTGTFVAYDSYGDTTSQVVIGSVEVGSTRPE